MSTPSKASQREPLIARIRSGGQSGVDRAALDAARTVGVEICGYVPSGGWAEDRPSPPGLLADYPELTELASPDPAARTRANVRDAHATLILCAQGIAPGPGTELTIDHARALGRPLHTIRLELGGTAGSSAGGEAYQLDGYAQEVINWLNAIGRGLTVNVAGPRESGMPGIYRQTRALLSTLLAGVGASW